jgi:hypothetical protein
MKVKKRFGHWLDAPDPSSNHNAACGKKQPGTGSWFLRCEQFMSWKMDPSSLLWVHGIREFFVPPFSATQSQSSLTFADSWMW